MTPPATMNYKAFFDQIAREAAEFAPSEKKAPPAPPKTSRNRTMRTLPRHSDNDLVHWVEVKAPRFPYIPRAVQAQVAQWVRELDAADELEEKGERVLPLMLEGETRCGKTSLASVLGHSRGVPVYRMNLAAAVGSYMGETAKSIERAFNEAQTRAGFWLVDEVDAVAFRRRSGQATEQERSHAVGTLLTKLEQLPAGLPLIGTTNHLEAIDPAVLGRFTCIKWPKWDALNADERREFLDAQGGHQVHESAPLSYADAVKLARAERIEAILSGKGKQLELGGSL